MKKKFSIFVLSLLFAFAFILQPLAVQAASPQTTVVKEYLPDGVPSSWLPVCTDIGNYLRGVQYDILLIYSNGDGTVREEYCNFFHNCGWFYDIKDH